MEVEGKTFQPPQSCCCYWSPAGEPTSKHDCPSLRPCADIASKDKTEAVERLAPLLLSPLSVTCFLTIQYSNDAAGTQIEARLFFSFVA